MVPTHSYELYIKKGEFTYGYIVWFIETNPVHGYFINEVFVIKLYL